MDLFLVAFYVWSAVTLGGALAVLFARSLVRAAVGLLAALAGAAGIFLSLGAEVVAALQVLIYVGGVVVLFLFALMVTPPPREGAPPIHLRRGIVAPVLAYAALAGTLVALLRVLALRPWPALPEAAGGTALEIGRALVTSFLLPFEAVSLLLLAGLVGAVVVIRKELAPR